MAKRNELRKTRRRVGDDGWRLPDDLWAKMEPLLPPRPQHPLGCHHPRVVDRAARDAIFFVLRTGCQWHALRETRICSSSLLVILGAPALSGMGQGGVFAALWREGLLAYDARQGLEWTWLALDGAMKAPLGGENRPKSDRPRQTRGQALAADRWPRHPLGVVIDGANRTPHKLTRQTLEAIPVPRPKPTLEDPQHLRLDKGFAYDEPRAVEGVQRHAAFAQPRRGSLGQASRPGQTRRWVVERTHAWFNRFRSILIRWTKNPANDRALLHFACAIISWHYALPG